MSISRCTVQKEKFLNLLPEIGWELVGDYINHRSPISLKCLKCEKVAHFKMARHFNQWKKCSCNEIKIDANSFQEILKKYNQTLISDYKTLFLSPVEISCNNCNYVRILNHASSFLKHPGCKRCNYKGGTYSQEEFLEKIKANGFKLICKEKLILSVKKAVEVECLTCGLQKKVKQLKNIINDKGKCKKCFPNQKYNISDVKSICAKYGVEFLDESYISVTHYHNFKCDKGHEMKKPFSECIRSFKRNTNSCKLCTINSLKANIEDVKAKVLAKNIEFLDLEFKGYNYKHNFKCCKCNHIWQARSSSIVMIDSGCPKCHLFINEKITGEELNKLLPNTKIIGQKKFKATDCPVRKKVSVDYYFEKNNNKYIVEYHGQQHYQPVDFTNGKKDYIKAFEEQKIRDEWLRNYCKNNSINLIEVDGREFKKEAIRGYLIEKLNSHFCLD